MGERQIFPRQTKRTETELEGEASTPERPVDAMANWYSRPVMTAEFGTVAFTFHPGGQGRIERV